MEGDGLELAPIGSLRDFWEITWGYAWVKVPGSSFWWAVGCRLWGHGMMSRTVLGPTHEVFKLKEKADGPA